MVQEPSHIGTSVLGVLMMEQLSPALDTGLWCPQQALEHSFWLSFLQKASKSCTSQIL